METEKKILGFVLRDNFSGAIEAEGKLYKVKKWVMRTTDLKNKPVSLKMRNRLQRDLKNITAWCKCDPRLDIILAKSAIKYIFGTFGKKVNKDRIFLKVQCYCIMWRLVTEKKSKRKRKQFIKQHACTLTFTVAKRWKQPECPPTDEWVDKIGSTHPVEYYSALIRKETLTQHGWILRTLYWVK